MLMEVKGVFGGGEWAMICGFLVVERWLGGGAAAVVPCRERRRREKREKVS